MLKTLVRPAMIFLPFLIGFQFPALRMLNREPWHLVRYCLMLMIFLSCLKITPGDLALRREHWKILGINLLAGIVPYALLRFFLPGLPALAEAAFFTGITPTATAAPVVVSFLNGKVGFALTGFTLTSCGVSLALLFLLPVVAGDFTFSFFLHVLETLLLVIALPISAAVLLRKWRPALRTLPDRCKNFTFFLWSVVLCLLAATASGYLRNHPEIGGATIGAIGAISLLLCIFNFYAGALVARRSCKRESSQILGQKNTSLTMYLALEFAGPVAALGPVFYIVWHNSWNAWQIFRMDRRKENRRQMRERIGRSPGDPRP